MSGYATDLCERAASKEGMGVSCKYEKTSAKEVADLTDALLDACSTLIDALDKMPADSNEAMAYCHKVVTADMAKAREIADKLETVTASDSSPYPVYADLLFSV